MSGPDFYAVLGVAPQATDDEIKKAFRALARRYHPDANPGDPDAAERFKEISDAYETLRDPERRRRYDMFGATGPGMGPGAGSPFGAGQFGLNDLFDAFFGGDGFGGGRSGGAAARGADAEVLMRLTLDEVVFGARRTIEVQMPAGCDACDGSGCAAGTHPERCVACGGTGEVRQVRRSMLGQLVTAAPCGTCGGTGQVIPDPCAQCRGAGRVERTQSIEVDVPAGIDTGQRLRLGGRGPAGARGAPSGDLYVLVEVAPHGRLERRGDELWCAVPVSMAQAALGTRIDVDTLDGPQELDVPPGTQPGAQLRVKGMGVPGLRSGRRGDLVAVVDIRTPTDLTAEEAELLEQFAAMRGEEVTPPHEGLFSRIRSAFRQ